MTYPRYTQLCLEQTSWYHVVVRCVRRAWLLGVDPLTGRDYSHRRSWFVERLAALSNVFAIDVAAYCGLSNHYHIVLHTDQRRARAWSAEEVAHRWAILFGTPELVMRWQSQLVTDAEREEALALIETWRAAL